ncbi:TetR/AcrR family transcriptional regulator [Bradyrhizobium embrapense]|uniref:TetR/AcrR family transcriptional regulator n=1 Tax=Bradyrhizobium embrapense TaxID=630921 RepID=UPI001FCDC6DA|nr:TetR/AcrR family transcriptional regulator [Bradyrhizobium embrapense]
MCNPLTWPVDGAKCEHLAHITGGEVQVATRIPAATSKMRKVPRQARSRATIEAILDAAAHILGERGWSATTTNAVAERAGVSIGSLYQYFPNKLALVEATRRRHFDELLAVLCTATDDTRSRACRIVAFVDGMIDVHRRFPAAHRVLLEEAPRDAAGAATHRRFETEYRKGCEALFTANMRGNATDTRIAARVLAAAVAGVVHEAARLDILASPALRQELIALVEACLSKRRAVAGK